jgi:prevent-host-death family protein
MNTANISYARNHLSELLNRVREGETILIVDRQTPVARLEPPAKRAGPGAAWKADLVRRGIVRPAKRPMDLKALSALATATPHEGGDVLAALLSEREDGR